ncbi:hypothetical protein HDE_09034 [Halotydeus destructor]|nr:hypothetical protein HDE_09034 [Halotydeus destructor]
MSYTSGHHHYLVPADKEKLRQEDMKTKIIIAYDIEAAQVRETDKTARHEANLLIAHVICDNCWDFSSKKPIDCSACVQHEHVFRGSDCVKNFVDFLINVVSKRAGKTQPVDIYAHNAKNYDSRFVLRELLRRKLVDIDLIMQGSKITRMKASNLRFVDSCAHFQQKLSKLPKSFDFADKVVKGFFPHLLNDGRDWNHYPRELPAPHLFGVETMQEEDRKGFEKWYTERSLTGVPWVFEEEIVKYCRNDVEVLLTAVQVYRKQMAEITGMDPTTRKFTLPGVTHEVFAANMLKPQAIGITPISNYAGRKQSYQGKAWLDAIELFTVGHRLEREKALGPYYADAYDKATNTVYEYWGCLWHGCPCAYGELEERDLKGRKLVKADLLKQKYEKLKYYERRGFNIVEEKECVFTRQIYKPTNYEVENESLESCRRREYCINRIQFYKQLHNDNNRCNIRGSFFGGRTGNASLFYECSEEEELKYYDFTSLYPHVLSAEAYPVGHPVEVNGNIDGSGEAFQGVLDRKYFGFVSCTVAPPHRARFGILPMRHDGKLVFPLCYTCTTQGDTGDCPHEECDRALNQTWSTPEIYKALEHGYRLLKVHHVLHYEKKDDQMFKEYIRMWLKIKQEASGWPGEVEKVRREQGEAAAQVAQQQYIASYFEKEGILLDATQICHNPGRRQIAKLMLNSFWGKFAQRPNLPQTMVITDYAQFRKLHDSPKYKIVGEHETGLDSFIVNYVEKDEEGCDPGKTSIAIASFVTAYARLKLYDLMRKVEYELPSIGRPRTLYYDTDSIIFIVRKDDAIKIPLGNYLGELTDEIAGAYGDSAYCKQAAFLGPKNYAYEIRFTDKADRVTCVKCKGITLYSSDLNIFREFSKVLDLAKTAHITGLQQEATFYQSGIRANCDTHQLRTVNFEKTIKTRLDKRRYIALLGYSVPIGFKQLGAPQAPVHGPPTSMIELTQLYFTDT